MTTLVASAPTPAARAPLVDITISGIPVAKGRPRFGKGRTYTPEKTAQAERVFSRAVRDMLASSHHLFPLAGALEMRCVFTMPMPKRGKVTAGDWHTVAPDADNLVKMICDSLNGWMWNDDAQVASLTVQKVWGEVPSTRLVVHNVGGGGL